MTQAAEAEYVALKRMKVQECDENGDAILDENGRPRIRVCLPGDPIPEATSWRNLWREVRAGRVGIKGTPFAGPALADSMRRMHANPGKPRRKKARRRRKLDAGEVATANATGQEPPVRRESVPDPGGDSHLESDSDVAKVELPGSESAPQE